MDRILQEASLCILFLLVFAHSKAAEKNLHKYVNPFIGASTSTAGARSYHGLGKTFPGAATPYGLTQVSPNTITGGDNGSGYSDEHKTIEGFAFTQMSGVGWYGDLGNFLVMPTTGKLQLVAGKEDGSQIGYRSEYVKSTETAHAGYYSTHLTRYKIDVEATASPHGGVLKFKFPKHKQSRIQIDLARRVGGTSTLQNVEVVDNKTICGWMKCTPEGGGWGDGDGKPNYTVYFYAEFSKELNNYGIWSADIPDDWTRKREGATSTEYQYRISQAEILKGINQKEGKHLGFYTEFSTEEGEEVTLKVGISFVDIDGAKKNFDAELKNESFAEVLNNTQKLWDNSLGRMTIDGATDEQKIIFYTALYHTMIDPRIVTDVDGRYTGGDQKIHKSNKFNKRTIFSGWDVFRSQFPLQTIINPSLVNDQINSLVTLAEESGEEYLERWEFFNAYSGCMVGNPAQSILTDAYMKGIRDYDIEQAYKYAVNTAERFSSGDKGFWGPPYSISNTLEYAYSDWCLSVLAKELGKEKDAVKYAERGQYYKNIFDAEKEWFRPRKDNGEWESWPEKGVLTDDYGCTESNPYQQGWFVPHDVDGMVKLMGGKEKVRDNLNHFFEQTPRDYFWNDYYNHANEPVHHVVFLFNRLGYPHLTQKWSRNIAENAYRNSVDGLVCNEDVGQMSAWYVLVASGLHPVCPGDTRYELTSPLFGKVEMQLENGKTFTINTINNSDKNIYIQKATLNGVGYPYCYIDHADIVAGGELILEMGSDPNFNLKF